MQRSAERKLLITFSITIGILVAEVVGGVLSNSLALLSDAGHVFTDSFALGLSLVAARVSRRPQDSRATYGYHRVALLAAVVNGVSLIFIAIFIFRESLVRFAAPPEINLALMMPVAAAGLVANIVMIKILGHNHGDLNVKSAWLHVVGDTLASVGVIVSGVIIYFTGWQLADPLAGALIGLIIVFGGSRVVKEAVSIFLDFVPPGYEIEKVADEILCVDGVKGVHDIHLRSLSHKRINFSAHVWVGDLLLSQTDAIRDAIEHRLAGMGIRHTTLQFESGDCDTEGMFCRTCAADDDEAHGIMHGHHDHGEDDHHDHGEHHGHNH